MKSAPAASDPDARPAGCLYLVSTPIGNLEDITVRALRVLGEADLIACEDTRETSKLLNHYSISKPVVSYHDHNEIERSAEIVMRLEEGAQVALVSDAGTPVISDPGHRLGSPLFATSHSRDSDSRPFGGALAALAASSLARSRISVRWISSLAPRRAAKNVGTAQERNAHISALRISTQARRHTFRRGGANGSPPRRDRARTHQNT